MNGPMYDSLWCSARLRYQEWSWVVASLESDAVPLRNGPSRRYGGTVPLNAAISGPNLRQAPIATALGQHLDRAGRRGPQVSRILSAEPPAVGTGPADSVRLRHDLRYRRAAAAPFRACGGFEPTHRLYMVAQPNIFVL